MNVLELILDRSMRPLTKPNGQGRQQGMKIQPADFNGDCEGIEFRSVAGKGLFLGFNAAPGVFQMIADALEDCLKQREASSLEFVQEFKNKGPSILTVGREDDGIPYFKLQSATNEGERSQTFYFSPPKNIALRRNGQPISELEMAERLARGWVRNAYKFMEALTQKYKPRVWEQKGSFGGGGGQQQRSGGYGGNQGGQQHRQSSAPVEPDTDFNNLF